MAIEKVKSFFEKLNEDPEAQKLFEALPAAENPEDAAKAYAGLAAQLGFSLTAEDFAEAYKESEARRHKDTEETAQKVGAIDDEELEAVAGGVIDHGDSCYSDWQCNKTYEDYENCWSNDACDNSVTHYKGYICYWENKGTCNILASKNGGCSWFF
ncbi:MAG: Nif11 family protein [Coriobacteriales bacterium]|nr:Nif11 family protein [Coriobacteriales bacterium]